MIGKGLICLRDNFLSGCKKIAYFPQTGRYWQKIHVYCGRKRVTDNLIHIRVSHLKNEDDLKKENDSKNEDDLKNKEDLKNEENLKNEDNLKNENDLKTKTTSKK